MRPPRLLLPVLLCAIALTAPQLTRDVGAYQHVQNSGFEQGLAGWGLGGGAAPTVVSLSGLASIEGTHALRIEAAQQTRLAQPLSAALGAGTYYVSVAARSDAGEGDIRAQIAVPGAGNIVTEGVATQSWSAIEGEFTITAPSFVSLTITAAAPAEGAMLIDDIRIDGADPVVIPPTATATHTPVVTSPTASTAIATSPTVTLTAEPPLIGTDIRNGDFEARDADGAPLGWEHYGGSLTSSSNARSGSSAARLESNTDSTKWLHQAVLVDEGATYAFSAWILHDDPAVVRAFLRVSWYDTSDGSGSNIGTEESTEVFDAPLAAYRFLTTAPITAPPAARSARVRIMLAPASAAPAAIYVDDAAFGVAQPLPPSPTPLPAGASAVDPARPANDASGSAPSRSRSVARANFVSSAGSASPSGARIVINEVLYDPDGDLADGDAEWVELYNAGTATIDLGGWMLSDGASLDVLPPFRLNPGAYAIVVGSAAATADTPPEIAARVMNIGGRIGNGLGNDGDALLLIAPDGSWADAISWGDDRGALDPAVDGVPAGHSIERVPTGADSDRASDFVDNASPSPGTAFVSAQSKPQPQLRPQIEILAGEGNPLAWLPWAITATSLAALGGIGTWRAVGVVRQRVRP